MTAKITTSDEFAGMRALRKLVEALNTKIIWGSGYLQLSAESFNAERGKPVQNIIWPPFDGAKFANDCIEFGCLNFQILMLILAEKPENRTPPERLQPWRMPPIDPKPSSAEIEEIMNWNRANAVRSPYPGEIEEMIKKLEGLFTYIIEPPPEPPIGGGRRKVA
jgi:hypothetical protein